MKRIFLSIMCISTMHYPIHSANKNLNALEQEFRRIGIFNPASPTMYNEKRAAEILKAFQSNKMYRSLATTLRKQQLESLLKRPKIPTAIPSTQPPSPIIPAQPIAPIPNEELERIRQENRQLHEHARHLQEQNAALRSKLKAPVCTSVDQSIEIERLQEELKQTQNRAEELSLLLETLNKDNEFGSSACLKRELATLQQTITELTARITTQTIAYRRSLDQLHEKSEKTLAEQATAHQRELADQAALHQRELSLLREDLARIPEAQKAADKAAADNLAQQMAALQKERDEANAREQATILREQAHAKELDQLRTSSEQTLAEQATAHQRELAEQAAALQRELSLLREDLARVHEAQKAADQAAADNLAQQIAALQKERDEANAREQATILREQAHAKELDQLRASSEQTLAEQATAHQRELAEQAAALQRELNLLREDLARAPEAQKAADQAYADNLAQQIAALQKERDEANAREQATILREQAHAKELDQLRASSEQILAEQATAHQRELADQAAALQRELSLLREDLARAPEAQKAADQAYADNLAQQIAALQKERDEANAREQATILREQAHAKELNQLRASCEQTVAEQAITHQRELADQAAALQRELSQLREDLARVHEAQKAADNLAQQITDLQKERDEANAREQATNLAQLERERAHAKELDQLLEKHALAEDAQKTTRETLDGYLQEREVLRDEIYRLREEVRICTGNYRDILPLLLNTTTSLDDLQRLGIGIQLNPGAAMPFVARIRDLLENINGLRSELRRVIAAAPAQE